MQRFSLQTLPRERWRNGAGWTRAVQQQGQGDALRWRVSLAEISQAAPFSVFEGLDRTTVLVKGGPVSLQGVVLPQAAWNPDEHWVLSELGDQARYPGELPLANAQPVSQALFWNVMVQRGVVQATVRLQGHEVLSLPAQGHSLVWVLRGRYALRMASGGASVSEPALGVDEGLSLAASEGAWQLHPLTADALLVHTHLLG